jgi:glucose/arabinose dehydrogenase
MSRTAKYRRVLCLKQLEQREVPATLPTGFTEFGITGILSSASAMQFAPDGKLFVLEQAGTMEVYEGSGASNWTQLTANFFTPSPLSVDSFFERGLLGIAFDPNYMTNRYLYIYYTVPGSPAFNRLARFTANAAGTQVVPGSQVNLVDFEALSAGNHNGGAIHFGPDGMLYVAIGDNAVSSNSQSLSNRFGKMLRINPVPGNTIPADNPTTIAGLGTTTGNNRMIWAAGLRNPFTFAFHPTTGRMHINDVGLSTYEEINLGAAGANYGWATTEGPFNQASFPNFTHPLVAYPRPSSGNANYPVGLSYQGRAIAGGAFYVTDTYTFPQDYIGDYFFGDYVDNWIRRYDYVSNTVHNFATGANGVLDLKIGPDGALYYLARSSTSSGQGRVFRVNYTGSLAPYIIVHPTNQTTSEGQPATFTVQAGGPGPLSYQWQKNEVDISGATSSSYTITMADLMDNNAQFRVRVTNATSSVFSNPATLTVNANQPPTPTIITPTVGSMFSYGDTISFSGSATDPEEGAITDPARFTWWVTYHTGPVERPFIPEFSGVTSGNFVLPTISPYLAPDVFYRVHLRVTDGLNAATEVFRDILPNTVDVTLASNPAGAPLALDGALKPTPHVFTGVTGLERSIGAPAGATINGFAYSFVSWAHGGPATQTISTPAANTTYTANYVQRPAQVVEFRIDDGTSQRSRIRSLQVTFDAILSPTASLNDAFALIGPMGAVPFTAGPIDNTSGRSVVPITFTGTLDNGSLPQGNYTFTVFGGQLVDGLNTALDGDANGSPGGNFVGTFHRLFGDATGDGIVGATDFNLFRLAYGTASTEPEFLFLFDFNDDGVISAADFAAFRVHYGVMI